MENAKKKPALGKGNMLVMSLVYLALGIVLLAWPDTVLSMACYVVGGVVILSGAIQIGRFFLEKERTAAAQIMLICGIVCAALGLFLVMRSDIVLTVLPVVFGLFVIFDSILRIQNALELKRSAAPNWWIVLLLAVLSVVLGFVMIYNPFGSAKALIKAVGIIFVVEGVLNLATLIYTFLVVRKYVKSNPAAEAAVETVLGCDINGDGVVGKPGKSTPIEASATESDAPADAAVTPAEPPEAKGPEANA